MWLVYPHHADALHTGKEGTVKQQRGRGEENIMSIQKTIRSLISGIYSR